MSSKEIQRDATVTVDIQEWFDIQSPKMSNDATPIGYKLRFLAPRLYLFDGFWIFFRECHMKSRKVRCLRQTTDLGASSDSEEDHLEDSTAPVVADSTVVVEAIRELQKLRKRPAGVSLSALATGKEVPDINLTIANDPFRLKTGGLVDLNSISSAKQSEEDDDVEARLAKTFTTETNKRDEDAEMIKYIEEEVAKRKGLIKPSTLDRDEDSDLLQDVPEYLKPSIGQQKEDMLSNQMLCGIPEVDLGVEAKMKNIEATEEAKQTLFRKRLGRKHGYSTNHIAPTSMAVNFVQHSRWSELLFAVYSCVASRFICPYFTEHIKYDTVRYSVLPTFIL
ncbi:unnamed protein product [Schistosoma rodhaini]|uniref:GPALPP motifs-containing protein 1 n=1 Tax=Schistosoma rodhaini TaxID=6188 RepID=A0AA85F9P5_9TREM|nr:unnamed protein product [Schistosoma rodhaini]